MLKALSALLVDLVALWGRLLASKAYRYPVYLNLDSRISGPCRTLHLTSTYGSYPNIRTPL